MTKREMLHLQEFYHEYRKTCKQLGIPALWPNPLRMRERMEKAKRPRRTKAQILAARKEHDK